jgi:hypothetical protein
MKIGIITGKSGNTLVKRLKELGHDVFVVSGDLDHGGCIYANDYFLKYFNYGSDNNSDFNKIITWLLEKEIQGFIMGTGVWFAHEIAILLFRNYNIPISHSIDHLLLFKNKEKTKLLFKEFNFNTPDYEMVYTRNPEVTLKFPFVVKSNIDLFPVWLCHSNDAFLKFLNGINEFVLNCGVLLEEFIQGNDLTIPVFARKNKVLAPKLIYWSKQLNYKLEGFDELTNDTVPLDSHANILSSCEKFISYLGYFGVCRFDIRVSNSNFYFLEINSVVSIRDEGSSFNAMKEEGINYLEESLSVYLENLV